LENDEGERMNDEQVVAHPFAVALGQKEEQ
jgi:hypothetical protein